MTPERIEKLLKKAERSCKVPDYFSDEQREAFRAALRQCAQEAADEALERAAEWCASARQEWIDKYGLDLRAYDAGRITALENAAIVIRALKGKQ